MTEPAVSVSTPPLLLIHGWALNHHVWKPVVDYYRNRYRVINIDLPGHGRSQMPRNNLYDIDSVVEKIVAILDGPVTVVGWSLGAMLAQRLAARFPRRVARLVAVAGTAQFVASDDWPMGVDAAIFASFATALLADYRHTIKRFLAIQSLGSAKAKLEIKTLSESIFTADFPHPKALTGCLRILQETRLQTDLSRINCPCLFVAGGRDSLVKAAASTATAAGIAQAQLAIIADAGHAPFISHPDNFFTVMDDFLNATES